MLLPRNTPDEDWGRQENTGFDFVRILFPNVSAFLAPEIAQIEQMISFLRDVTYNEDYLLGLKIQQGLKSGGVENLVCDKNERGNQFFHEIVGWYPADDKASPMPLL